MLETQLCENWPGLQCGVYHYGSELGGFFGSIFFPFWSLQKEEGE